MSSYGLRKFNVRKDLHLINERLKMGSKIQNNVQCMGIYPSKPLMCIEWAVLTVTPGPLFFLVRPW